MRFSAYIIQQLSEINRVWQIVVLFAKVLAWLLCLSWLGESYYWNKRLIKSSVRPFEKHFNQAAAIQFILLFLILCEGKHMKMKYGYQGID